MKLSRRGRTRMLALLFVLALLGFVQAPGTAAMAASPSCYNTTCNGKDPSKTGCDKDAITLEDVIAHGIRVRLIASTACDAAWAKGTSSGPCWDSEVSLRYYLPGEKASAARQTEVFCPGYTYMIGFASYHVEACGEAPGAVVVQGRDCTVWR